MSERIEIRDGKAYIAVDTWLYSRPVRRTLFWLLDVDPACLSQDARADYIGSGVYYVEIGPMRVRRDVAIRNKRDDAMCDFYEEYPIPPPRGKSQVRYDGCSGAWERLTRKGWVRS